MMSGDDQGRLPETPDVSLGSLCQNTTGEQLDDMDFDQMYDSPAVSSMSFGEGSGIGPITSGINLRSTSTRVLWPAQGLGGSPQEFDSLPLLDISELFGDDFDEGVWLIKPPSEIPPTFNEEDRSYLDTSLLNLRFSLLNIVSADMNGTLRGTEEIGTENYSPKSNPTVGISTGSATIRINKSSNRQRLGYRANGADSFAISDAVTGMDSSVNSPIRSYGGSLRPIINHESDFGVINSNVYNANSLSSTASLDLADDRTSFDAENTISASRAQVALNEGYSTFTRPRNVDVLGDNEDDDLETRATVSPSYTVRVHESRDFGHPLNVTAEGIPLPARISSARGSPSYTIARHGGSGLGAMEQSSRYAVDSAARTSPSFVVETHNNQDYGPPSHVLLGGVPLPSRVPQVGTSPSYTLLRHGEGVPGITNIEGMSPISRVLPPATSNLSPRRNLLRDVDELGSLGASDARNTTYSEEQSYLDHASREIDSRTYTRTKKNRMSLAHSSHPLNTTIDLSPPRSNSGSPSKRLNTTISISPDQTRQGAVATNPVNLNETFDAEEGERNNEVNSDRSRKVKRNQSYVIRREDEPSNNNTLPHAHASPAGGQVDLNNTFTYEGDGEVDVCQMSRVESHNNSMEGLNSRVESQIRSLGCNPTGVHRGRFSDQNERAIRQMEEARLVGRTLSTDTYSLAQSSDSASSDLSSPMDTQSYDDLQANEAVRRSMPNLASRAATGIRSNLGFPQTSSGQLCKKDYMVSDSRLTRLGSSDRPRLSVMTSETRNMGFSRGSVTSGSSSSRATDRNTSNPSLNRTMGISSGIPYQAPGLGSHSTGRRDMSAGRPQGTMAGVRAASGMQGPRYVGVSSGIARPPRATSGIPTARGGGVPRSGLPVPSYRSQSRLAAPGTLRSAVPSQRSALYQPRQHEPSKTKDWQDGCY